VQRSPIGDGSAGASHREAQRLTASTPEAARQRTRLASGVR